MNRTVKYSIGGAFAAIVLAGYCILTAQCRADRSMLTCGEIEISFTDSLRFLSEEDVRECIDKGYGAYIGQRLDSIKLHRIEEILQSESSVKDCQAWTTDNGILHVRVRDRVPVVLLDKGGRKMYSDAEGCMFDPRGKEVDGVTVISGDLPDSPQWLTDAIGLVGYLKSSRIWRDKVDKIYVRKGGDLCIKLKGGNERFILGYPDNLEEKFGRIGRYFQWIRPDKGEDCYKSVNVKYNKQIICRKDI